MKKWIAVLVSVVMVLTMTGIADADMMDVNNDGIVSTGDARMMLKAIVDELALSARQQVFGDYDRDGVVSTSDVRVCLAQLATEEKMTILSVPFHTYYVDVARTVSNVIPDGGTLVVTSEEEWNAFTTADETIDSRVFYQKKEYNETFFANNAMIIVPYHGEDMYIADVAADNHTIYVSTITIAGTDATPRTAYAIAIVDNTVVQNKTITVTGYTEETPTVVTTLTEAKRIFQSDYKLDYQNNSGKYDYNNPIVLSSVSDCEAFVDEHTTYGPGGLIESYLCSMEKFEEYDDAFFEENSLMLYPVYDWFEYPVTGDALMQTVVYDDHMITTFSYTAKIGSIALDRTELNVYCIPIPREYYTGQEMSVVFYGDVKYIE